jgi:3-methyladenine DNA glycosylase Mpg
MATTNKPVSAEIEALSAVLGTDASKLLDPTIARAWIALLTAYGRVTRALGINRSLDGHQADDPGLSRLGAWIEEGDDPWPVPPGDMVAGPRVGVAYAGPEWAAKPWRFRWMTRWSSPRPLAGKRTGELG